VGVANVTPKSASGVKKCLGLYAYDLYKVTQMDAAQWKTRTLSTNMFSAEIQKQCVNAFS
jgi:hypothetical protein